MARAHSRLYKKKSACRDRGRRIKVAEGELSIRVQRVGIRKSQTFPSNVAGEKRLYLPEGSKASFVGVFFHFLWLLSGSSAYLYVGKKKTHLYVMIKRSEEQLPAGNAVASVFSFNISLIEKEVTLPA